MSAFRTSLRSASLTLAAVLSVAPAAAQSLSFSPQRIVLDARLGSSALTLTNTGKRDESYRVELIDILYKDDGGIAEVRKAPPGYPSAKEIVRFSPSQVRLKPGESQKIRLLLRSPTKPADGEYRVHAKLRQLPNVTDVKPQAAGRNQVAGVVGVEQAVAIPVIVRFGNTSATGKINSARLITQGKAPALELQLGRSGNRSLYTNLVVKDRSGAVAKTVKGVAVPVPNQQRRFVMTLDAAEAGRFKRGGYSVEMVDHDTNAVIDRRPLQ